MLNSGEIVFNPPPPRKKARKKKGKESQRLTQLVEKSHRILLEISTVFPFDPFPDKLTIDENKVNLINYEFFFSGRTHSVMIKDISDVLVDSGFFFAKLQIIDRGFVENSIELKFLWTEDAQKARRIIQGLIVAQNEGIDISKIETAELAQKLEKLGEIQE